MTAFLDPTLTDRAREAFDDYHRGSCTVDAGGGCYLHDEEREAFVAGAVWQAMQPVGGRSR